MPLTLSAIYPKKRDIILGVFPGFLITKFHDFSRTRNPSLIFSRISRSNWNHVVVAFSITRNFFISYEIMRCLWIYYLSSARLYIQGEPSSLWTFTATIPSYFFISSGANEIGMSRVVLGPSRTAVECFSNKQNGVVGLFPVSSAMASSDDLSGMYTMRCQSETSLWKCQKNEIVTRKHTYLWVRRHTKQHDQAGS